MKCLAAFILLSFAVCESLRSDKAFWQELAENELNEALKVKLNLNTAKNVIVFVGDSMGPNTITATRIYKGGESHRLAYEDFPHVGLMKTYSANKMTPDSAAAATAMFCGVKTNEELIGLDATVTPRDCEASLNPDARLESLATNAMMAGKSAGFVTTMRVTHTTPGPLFAQSADRKWECEAYMPAGTERCKDIARQLIEDWPGRGLNVILGGGRQMLVSDAPGSDNDPVNLWSCKSQDGRNLINDYIVDKQSRGLTHAYVETTQQLKDVNFANTDYLLGIFANGHLKYEYERNKGPDGMPHVAEMTEAAIKVLQNNNNGYFLMVEGGNIDMAHHRGRAKTAIEEAVAFEEAVKVAMELTSEEDTLIIVTADHSHTLSINGYAPRGSDIFGIAGTSLEDGVPYTTLSYSTGGPGSMHYYAENNNGQLETHRRDPTGEDTKDEYYEQVAGIMLDENSHGGNDVTVYARGPYSHLFHNVHEQHYLYYAVSYASKIGNFRSNPFDDYTAQYGKHPRDVSGMKN